MGIIAKGRYKAIQAIKGNNGVTKGYVLVNDITREMVEVPSKDIKEAIIKGKGYICPPILILNLKVTEDGKLIHVKSLDRLGMGIPPQQFFNGKAGNWTIVHANDGSPKIKATNSSGKSIIVNYKYSVDRVGYDDMRAVYDLSLDNDIARGTSIQFAPRIDACSIKAFEDLEKALNKLITRDLSDLKLRHMGNIARMVELQARKESLEDDYTEDAAHDLADLKKLEAVYNNTPEHKQFIEDAGGWYSAAYSSYSYTINGLERLYGHLPRYKELMQNLDNLSSGEILSYIDKLRQDEINKQEEKNNKKHKGTPSPYPGIIYESSARTRSQWYNSLDYMMSNGIHAYNSMEYWWSLDPEERQKEIHDPESPWYHFEG